MGTWGLTGISFLKISMCSTTVADFMFLAYSYREIWPMGRNDPTQVYTDPKEHRFNRVKINLVSDRSARGNFCPSVLTLLSLHTKCISTLMLIPSSVLVQIVSSMTSINKSNNQIVN